MWQLEHLDCDATRATCRTGRCVVLLLDGFDGCDGAHWSSIELPWRASKKVALSSVGCDVRDSNGSTGARKPKVCGDIFSMHGYFAAVHGAAGVSEGHRKHGLA